MKWVLVNVCCVMWIFTLSVGIIMGLSGCNSARSSQIPSWWNNPHQHDEMYLYFTAEGTSAKSYEDARKMAQESVKSKLVEYILSDIVSSESHHLLSAELTLHGLDTSYGDDEGRVGGIFHVWLMGRYPIAEYKMVRMRLEKGQKLLEVWGKAQSAVNRQQYKEAEILLLSVIKHYDSALRVSFDLEEVKLALAGTYLKQDKGLKARHWIVDVQNSTQMSIWRNRANELFSQLPAISLKDAFDGQGVGIYACIRSNGEIAIDADLMRELEVRLAKDGMQTSNCLKIVPTSGFDHAAFASIAESLATQNATVAFVLLLDIDPSKTGAKVPIPGTDATTDALDAKLTYFIVRTVDGHVLASDSTLGLSSAKAGMVNTILTHRRHLPNYAPVIADGLVAP